MWTVPAESNALMLLELQHFKTLQKFCRNRRAPAPCDRLGLTSEQWRDAFAEGQGCRDAIIHRLKQSYFANLKQRPQADENYCSKFFGGNELLYIACSRGSEKIEILPRGDDNAIKTKQIDDGQNPAYGFLSATDVGQRAVARVSVVSADANPPPKNTTSLRNVELCKKFNLQPSGSIILLSKHLVGDEFIPKFLEPRLREADLGSATQGQSCSRVGSGDSVLEFFAWPKKGKIVIPLSPRSSDNKTLYFRRCDVIEPAFKY